MPARTEITGSRRRARADHGLITLEWLLVVAAVAGLAASSVLTVQRVLDEAADAPVDPLVRALEADVAAAFLAAEAQSVYDDHNNPSYDDTVFKARCETTIKDDFTDVVNGAVWFTPTDNGTPSDPLDDLPARCVLTPRPDLGG